jgi:internalin A
LRLESDAVDGLAVARERIAREAEEKTGFLDLGMLGLRALPEELFSLKRLRRLNLGRGYFDQAGKWQELISDSELGPNAVEGQLDRLAELIQLEEFFLVGTDLADLAPLKGLTSLQTLSCSHTQVSDLAPLRGPTTMQTLD